MDVKYVIEPLTNNGEYPIGSHIWFTHIGQEQRLIPTSTLRVGVDANGNVTMLDDKETILNMVPSNFIAHQGDGRLVPFEGAEQLFGWIHDIIDLPVTVGSR